MKSKLLFLLLAVVALTNFQCGEDPKEAPFTLTFKAVFNGQPLVTATEYEYTPGKKIIFTRYNHFVSNVELIRENGQAVRLTDVQYFRLDSPNDAQAQAGKTLTINGIPVGTYKGLRLGWGVSPEQNSINPNTLPDTHPLAVNGRNEFWTGWQSYIFMKIEGLADQNGDNKVDGFDSPGLVLHCGSDAVFRTVEFTQLITVGADGGALEITSDLAKFLMKDGLPLDLKTHFATSDDPSNVVEATILMDNASSAISIK